MPTKIDQPAMSGVNSARASSSGARKTAEDTAGWAKSATQARTRPKMA
jgi:hypothetical protein